MPDQSGVPPIPFSFATLINRLRGQSPANYSYAQSRLGRQPMIYANDPEQFRQLRGTDYGSTFSPGAGQSFALAADPTTGPLADPVRALLGSTGEPVSVIAPYRGAAAGPAGHVATEPGVPLHESTHQFIGENKLPIPLLYTRVPKDIQEKIFQALTARNYPTDRFSDEIPARLAAGQFASLGLSPEEGRQVWQTYLDLYQKQAPEKARRFQAYTRGRTGNVDPTLSTSSPATPTEK